MERPDTWYRIRVAAIPVFVAAYIAIAGMPALLRAGSGEEKYLFYHWFVFTDVPSREQTTYEAFVTRAEGKPLEPAVRMESADVLFFDELRNKPEYNRRIRMLGAQLADGSPEANRARETLEAYIIARPLTYEIREIRYNPIDRLLTGAIISEKTITSFTVN